MLVLTFGLTRSDRFHWVSLCPRSAINGIRYDAIGINDDAVVFLNESREIHRIRKETGCDLWIPKKSFAQEDPREIGFRGTKEAIKEAKALVIKKISESGEGAIVPFTIFVLEHEGDETDDED
jgi:hypothetical protein